MLRFLILAAAFAIAGVAQAANVVGNSALLSNGDVQQLETWLGEGTLTLTKVFSSTVGDGKTSTHFHAALDGKLRTFTVIELPPQGSYGRKVIGGYNPQSWDSSNNYHYSYADADRTGFLFNLTTSTLHRQKLDGVYGTGQYQTYNSSGYGPTFGGGHDLYTDSNLHSGYTNQYSYGPVGYASAIAGGGQGGGLTYGTLEVFTVAVTSAPAVNTIAADRNTRVGATLNAKVTSNERATDVVFEYSTSPNLASGVVTTSPQSLASDAVGTLVSQVISGLTPQATYYFRAVATNSLGTTNGVILSFTATDTSIAYRFSPSSNVYGYGNYVFGSEFKAVTACKLTHLGTYDHNQDGLVVNAPVGLWSASGVLLASTTVLSSDPLNGNCRYHALTNPVSLTAGMHFFVGAVVNSADPSVRYAANFVADSRIAYVKSAHVYSYGVLTFPTSSTGTTPDLFGANFLLESAVTAPFADAGADQTVNESDSVSLNGASSHDTNAQTRPITYAWTQQSGPTPVDLTGLDTATPSFTAPSVPAAGAVLVFQLTVNNGSLTSSDTVSVNISNVNRPPVPNAGPDQAVDENTLVTLDSSRSSDADGDALTMRWTQVPGFGPTVVLDGADTDSPTFTAFPVTAAEGMVDVKFELVVNDGLVSSGPSPVTIHVKNTNDAPISNAGPNQSVNELDPVTLNGTGSSDPDNDPLTYSWTQIPSATVALSGANTATPAFQAPELSLGGMTGGTTLTFELTVNDGKVNSTTSAVNVRVSNVNHPPLADAGIDQTVPSTTVVSFDGSLSADTDGDALTYAWAQTGGTSVTLSSTDTAAISFTAPVAGTSGSVLKFQLTVDDGYGGVTSDEVVVKVTYVNHPPTASAGTSQPVYEGNTATLAGTASDPDGNELAITWMQVSGPAVTIINGSTLAPSFVAPLVTRAEDNVVLRLTVDDGYHGSASSDVTVHIANINHAPTVQAPANMSVPEGSPVSLIGQGSDPDPEEQGQLTYSWQQVSGPAVTLSGAGANVGFDAPLVTAGGDPNAKATLVFRLTVTDPNAVSASDEVTVVVTNVDHAPTAVAGANLAVDEAASVTLNGSASSDPDGDALSYAWVQTAGLPVALNDANTAYPYFTAPFVKAAGATLKFTLTVKDGFNGISSDIATVTVANLNDAPIATNAQPSVATLWPPDHSMVKVSILGVIDPNNNATITITGVTQDEATNGLGDGDTAIDAIINADGTVLLRSERSGKGDGRVYRISFTASDLEGSSSGVVKVTVPKSKKTDVAIDSGGVFNSTE